MKSDAYVLRETLFFSFAFFLTGRTDAGTINEGQTSSRLSSRPSAATLTDIEEGDLHDVSPEVEEQDCSFSTRSVHVAALRLLHIGNISE